MDKQTIKTELESIAITFSAAFLMSLTLTIDTISWNLVSKEVIIAALIAAGRAATKSAWMFVIKPLIQKFYNYVFPVSENGNPTAV